MFVFCIEISVHGSMAELMTVIPVYIKYNNSKFISVFVSVTKTEHTISYLGGLFF